MINNFIIASNPFFDAYSQSDILGKLIFIALILLSICSWVVLLHKLWLTYTVRQNSRVFQQKFYLQKQNPLQIETDQDLALNPFKCLYKTLKVNTLEVLNKNKHFKGNQAAHLSPIDVDFVEGHLMSQIVGQVKSLEKNLFVLATVVSLGPFLGLLGTVWGILTTFSDMTNQTGGSSSQAVLAGLSLALATTVLGIVAAIPALIGYNYLKNSIKDYEADMEGFAHEMLSSVEMQYRKVE